MLFSWFLRNEKQEVSPEITQVYLELSTFCNLSCRTCIRSSIIDLKPSHLPLELVKKIVPMLSRLKNLRRIVLLGFGEALCNPDIKKILICLRKLGAEITLVTNAIYLTEEMSEFLVSLPVNELFVSWDDDILGGPKVIRPGAEADIFRNNVEGILSIRNRKKSELPLIGLEIVAARSNYKNIRKTIKYGRGIGIEKFVVTGLYPYSAEMKDEILYAVDGKPRVRLSRLLWRDMKRHDIRAADHRADKNRRCPFIEKGTVFITSDGDIAPCPELAYSHSAYYFGSKRFHRKKRFGGVSGSSIKKIWDSDEFTTFRNKFSYFDFPDCSTCYEPDRCYHRTVDATDCYRNDTPCGECLWAKNIVICP
jgi:Fe-coproporphyrin III synthase